MRDRSRSLGSISYILLEAKGPSVGLNVGKRLDATSLFPVQGVYKWWFLKAPERRALYVVAAVFSLFVIVGLMLALHRDSNLCYKKRKICTCDLIVPDIIHFYRSERGAVNISRPESLCIKAAGRLHEQVWIHSTDTKSTFQEIKKLGLTSPNIKVLQEPYGPGPVHLNILRNYGGIFLKNDIYLLERLDQMRGHDWSSVGQNDIVAGTQDGVANGKLLKLKEILFDKNYGALYIRDIMQNCTYSAVRLGIR